MSRERPEAEQIGAVVERLSVLLSAGVTPQDAWRYLAESRGVSASARDASLPASRHSMPVASAVSPRAAERAGATATASGEPGTRGRARSATPVSDPTRKPSRSPVDAVIARVVHDIEAGRPVADAIGAAGRGLVRGPVARASEGGRQSSRTGDGGRLCTRASGFTGEAAWSALAAAWFIASEAGAPLAACLDDIACCLLAAGEVERDTAAALAGPVATTRMVIALPLVSIVAGAVLGLDTLRILFTTPAGVGCLVAGGVLLLMARAWSARLLRGARRIDAVPGLALELVAVAASGGGSLHRAVELVDEALGRFEVVAANDPRAVGDVLRLAARAGAPPGDLLKAEAMRVRRDAVGLAKRRAAALDVWLMMPLGVCVLPAFVLFAVVPVVVGVISTLSVG